MPQMYNDPAGLVSQKDSTIGSQIRTDFFQKKALIEAAKETYFGQLADVTSMPKNMGKTIKKYHYLPLLDDANINDEGIDAQGLSVNVRKTIIITMPGVTTTGNGWGSQYATGDGIDDTAATAAAEAAANDCFKNAGVFNTDYATTKAALEALTPAWTIDDTNPSVPNTGNLYGSSKDVGTIAGKLPALSEVGGRVNRVGFKRIELEGTIEKFGFFDEYTQESLDFDSDAELEMHVHSEMVKGANEITEDALQIDLLNSAGVIRFGGDATADSELTGNNGSTASLITYEDFVRMSIELSDNRTPKNTKLITGSRMVDTKTINGAHYMYVGSELIPMLRKMTDSFGNQAFVSVEKYASAGNIANGEIGSIDQFRIIVVPEMMHWAGVGAAVTTNDGYMESGGKYNAYPMLVIGSGSFTTIGFQTDGKTVKFKIKHAKPGSTESYANDPFGETGFMSIKWYYGFMVLRPERIALAKTVATW